MSLRISLTVIFSLILTFCLGFQQCQVQLYSWNDSSTRYIIYIYIYLPSLCSISYLYCASFCHGYPSCGSLRCLSLRFFHFSLDDCCPTFLVTLHCPFPRFLPSPFSVTIEMTRVSGEEKQSLDFWSLHPEVFFFLSFWKHLEMNDGLIFPIQCPIQKGHLFTFLCLEWNNLLFGTDLIGRVLSLFFRRQARFGCSYRSTCQRDFWEDVRILSTKSTLLLRAHRTVF